MPNWFPDKVNPTAGLSTARLNAIKCAVGIGAKSSSLLHAERNKTTKRVADKILRVDLNSKFFFMGIFFRLINTVNDPKK